MLPSLGSGFLSMFCCKFVRIRAPFIHSWHYWATKPTNQPHRSFVRQQIQSPCQQAMWAANERLVVVLCRLFVDQLWRISCLSLLRTVWIDCDLWPFDMKMTLRMPVVQRELCAMSLWCELEREQGEWAMLMWSRGAGRWAIRVWDS